jgi:MerR family transcriptional regulator, light-induced transcriptional regulator
MLNRVIESSTGLRVSLAAAQVFSVNAERLANLVTAHIEGDPRTPVLIGFNQPSLMRDSHNNRASLLKFVFRHNAWELLVRTVSWEYRTLHARGCFYEYFPIEFAAWKRAVQQLEQSCAMEICAVFDWLINQHDSTITLAQAGEGLETPCRQEFNAEQQAFLALLLQGNSKGALDLAQRTIHDVGQLQNFYLHLITPVLYRVGLLWERNEVSMAQEHLATAIAGRLMGALHLRFAKLTGGSKTALVASGPRELHDIGARMVADFLEEEGWKVDYLGGNLGQEEILNALKWRNPFLLALSVSSVFSLEGAEQLIRAIRSDAETRELRVMLGGFAFNCFPRLCRDFQADSCEADAKGAASAANAWWEQGPQ